MDAQRLAPGLPPNLNLGSGKDFREDFFNLDVDDTWAPDAVCDLSAVDATRGITLATRRFGEVTLQPACFDLIIANDVLEHVPNLMAMMTTCLALLRVDGSFRISVPYDLSFGAWQDPTHVRAFNERSWLYYTDWFWYMGWSDFRFALDAFDFVPSPLGEELKAKGVPRDEILRTPRAIDSMSVTLRKIALTAEDHATWAFWRERKRLAQERKSGVATVTEGPAAPKAFGASLLESRNRYAIWIVTPEAYSHQQAYDDVAIGLSEAFDALGGSAPVVRDLAQAAGRDLIVLGPQLLPAGALDVLPKTSVLFNLEQVQQNSPWMTETYRTLLRQWPVIDYSVRNHRALADLGVAHARLLPIGYAGGLSRIRHAVEKDIDVLFYGSLNERRRLILDELTRRGARVLHLFGAYGAERDAAIARAKVVLNLHFYEAAIFEAVRVSFLLANEVCVVTEGELDDPDLAPFRDGLAICEYGALADRCMALLGDGAARAALARAGLAAIKRRSQADLLRALFTA